MINYEISSSPFFEENKIYLTNLLTKIQEFNPETEGECNSYGFDVSAKFEKDSLQYTIKLHKHQSTQNGVLLPKNASNLYVTEIEINGIKTEDDFEVAKSNIRRLLMNRKIKDSFPSPYFACLKNENNIEILSEYITENKIESIRLSKGILNLKVLGPIENFDLINQTEKLISNCI